MTATIESYFAAVLPYISEGNSFDLIVSKERYWAFIRGQVRKHCFYFSINTESMVDIPDAITKMKELFNIKKKRAHYSSKPLVIFKQLIKALKLDIYNLTFNFLNDNQLEIRIETRELLIHRRISLDLSKPQYIRNYMAEIVEKVNAAHQNPSDKELLELSDAPGLS